VSGVQIPAPLLITLQTYPDFRDFFVPDLCPFPPIVRKSKAAKANVEFGAKISVSLIDGFSFVDRISWDNYNESCYLKDHIESYYNRYGFYPESVHTIAIDSCIHCIYYAILNISIGIISVNSVICTIDN